MIETLSVCNGQRSDCRELHSRANEAMCSDLEKWGARRPKSHLITLLSFERSACAVVERAGARQPMSQNVTKCHTLGMWERCIRQEIVLANL